MMRILHYTLATLAAAMVASCDRAPTHFDCAFSGEASGSGFVRMDQLSTDRTRGIVFHTDLMPPKGNGVEAKLLKRLHDEGVLNVECRVGAGDLVTAIQVYEFTNAVSGFTWYHGSYQAEVARQWDAESGSAALVVRRTAPSGMVFTASVTLSNVVFRTNGQKAKRRIERLTISDVPVGGMRW